MDVEGFLEEVRSSPAYAGQMVYVHEEPARAARYADPSPPLPAAIVRMLRGRGLGRLYSHQAEAIDRIRAGEDVLIVTPAASGKSLCYLVPILERLLDDPGERAVLLFPTKALCQDQFRGFSRAAAAAGVEVLSGVYDGDTPARMRRKLRDHASVVFTNPDMVHAAMLPAHGRWAAFLAGLKIVVLDELHACNGIFGSNVANLVRRLLRICRHYGSAPQFVACSATIGNPAELAERLIGRKVAVIDADGSGRGRRTYVFWNPPRVRARTWRSRRSANVEAHELMARLIERGEPTITFSKAKMTAEMIHRYVGETLARTAPHLVGKVTPYRGGYLPGQRREIERRLFSGELLGVSATRALELGIDVGALEACILVGYPGTLASFFQQSGRAGRTDRDALVVLVGLDTSVNQYVMSHPEYVFGRPMEQAVIDPENPFVLVGQLRCAAHELPLSAAEAGGFGPHAETVLGILEENLKLRRIDGRWYHAAAETPQHEVSLRDYADQNVVIEDAGTGALLGEVNRFDAPPILHPEAIYMHRGETYRVLKLDLEKNVATVKREEVDYYTQPIGGTDIHHVDARLRAKPFGSGAACWGEVTAYFRTVMYEKVHFYSLDAISRHGLDLPTFVLETMAVWLVPPEELMEEVRRAGLDAHSGLRGIGYATRMLLPLFVTCQTLDFSHTVGAANAEWNAVFIYERYPHGLGFTEKAYERLAEIMPSVLEAIRTCPCPAGCPCCVGKPLRQYATWNVERGEASIPSKASAILILEGLLSDGANLRNPDTDRLSDSPAADRERLAKALRRRLERMREPQVFHPIRPNPPAEYPAVEKLEDLPTADVARRAQRRRDFHRQLRNRIAKHLPAEGLEPTTPAPRCPPGMKTHGGNLTPRHFPGKPPGDAPGAASAERPIRLGDDLAAKARKMRKKKRNDDGQPAS